MAPPPAGPAVAHPQQPVSVSRQPILRSDFEVYGYELFFAADQPHTAGRRSSPRELVDFAGPQISRLVGTRLAFINVTEEVILSGCCDCLPARQVVLEVLEDVPPDPGVIRELQRLSRRGYRIALDDFVYSPSQMPLVDLADIIKIDVLATGNHALEEVVESLEPLDAQLLAEKVETGDALQLAQSLGFDYFQGFLLGHPMSEW